MPVFRLNIIFSGIDFDDDITFEALARIPNIVWRGQGGLAFATATVDAAAALQAADIATEQVTASVPTARPLRLDEDLVAIPDIAGRVGVSREAVRNWANGTRHANFPIPRGIVGDGIKVWAWSDVNRWLRENLSLGDTEDFPTEHDAALINLHFSDVLGHRSRALPTPAIWSVAETISVSTDMRVLRTAGQRRPWIGTRSARVQLTVNDGGVHAAA
jgi:hypothetical protein